MPPTNRTSSSSAAGASKPASSFAVDRRRTIKPNVQACAECRRLKLKCSRVWPCTTCVKRGMGTACPEGELTGGWKKARENLIARVSQLEEALAAQNIPVPPLESSPSPSASAEAPVADEEEPVSGPSAGNESLLQSFGTLSIGDDGRARYVGPSAGTAWMHSASAPRGPHDDTQSCDDDLLSQDLLQQMRFELPPLSSALALIDLYFAHYGWMYYVVGRERVDIYLDGLYSSVNNSFSCPHPHHLAVVFSILAVGSIFKLDITEREATAAATKWYTLARTTLAHSRFLTQNTIASLQALHILGAYFHNQQQDGGDSFWPILGMTMRIIQAMGVHRDGAKFGLSGMELNERRRVFWEWYSIDSFQSLCFGRPYAIAACHLDCQIPEEPVGRGSAPGFLTLKYRLCSLLNKINDEVYSVNPPDYATVVRLSNEIRDFHADFPPHLRCAAATAGFKDQSGGDTNAPVSYSAQILAYEQHTLACNVNEALLFLHRNFFAQALNDVSGNLANTFAPSLTVISNCCQNIINILRSMFMENPLGTMRHYFIWFHAFGAAVCMAATVIRAPSSPLAGPAWKSLTYACEIFNALPGDARARRPLPALARLYQRAQERLFAQGGSFLSTEDIDNEVCVAMLGISTRLVHENGKSQTRPRHHRSSSVANPVTSHDISLLFALPSEPSPPQTLPAILPPSSMPQVSTAGTAYDASASDLLLNDIGDTASWLGKGQGEWGDLMVSLGIDLNSSE